MNVKVIRDAQGLRDLESSWNELVRNGPFQAPYYSWDWQWIWWKHFGDEGNLFVAVVEDERGDVLAIAPLMKRNSRLRGLPVRELTFAANPLTPRSSILCRCGEPGLEAVNAVFQLLATRRAEWDLVTLANVDESLPNVPAIEEHCQAAGLRRIALPGRTSPKVAIGSDFPRYFTELFSAKRRESVRYSRRMLLKQDYRVCEFRRPEEMEMAIDLAFAVSKASWKGTIGADMSARREQKAFYREMATCLAARGQVRIWISFVGDRPIAVQFNLTGGKALHGLVNDFDEEFSRFSPGTVLLYHVIEQLHGEDVDEMDLGGDSYEYKMKWATGMRRHVTMELFNGRSLSSFVHFTKRVVLPTLRSVKGAFRSHPGSSNSNSIGSHSKDPSFYEGVKP